MIFSLRFLGLAAKIKCKIGLRPHVSDEEGIKKFKKCGVEAPVFAEWKAKEECESCGVTDFWIKDFDLPLSFYHCSSSKLPALNYQKKDCGVKNAYCKQGDFKKHFEEKVKLKDMKEVLQNYAKDSAKASKGECLKMISNIEAISYIRCTGKNDCFNKGGLNIDYCPKENDPRGKKCKASNLITDPPKTGQPNPQTSKTDEPKPQSSKTDQPQVQSSKADVTVSNSNETGNATTIGVGGNNYAIIYATYFVLLILSNIFN